MILILCAKRILHGSMKGIVLSGKHKGKYSNKNINIWLFKDRYIGKEPVLDFSYLSQSSIIKARITSFNELIKMLVLCHMESLIFKLDSLSRRAAFMWLLEEHLKSIYNGTQHLSIVRSFRDVFVKSNNLWKTMIGSMYKSIDENYNEYHINTTSIITRTELLFQGWMKSSSQWKNFTPFPLIPFELFNLITSELKCKHIAIILYFLRSCRDFNICDSNIKIPAVVLIESINNSGSKPTKKLENSPTCNTLSLSDSIKKLKIKSINLDLSLLNKQCIINGVGYLDNLIHYDKYTPLLWRSLLDNNFLTNKENINNKNINNISIVVKCILDLQNLKYNYCSIKTVTNCCNWQQLELAIRNNIKKYYHDLFITQNHVLLILANLLKSPLCLENITTNLNYLKCSIGIIWIPDTIFLQEEINQETDNNQIDDSNVNNIIYIKNTSEIYLAKSS